MANYSLNNNYQSLIDLLNPKKEEQLFSPINPTSEELSTPVNPTPDQLASIMEQQRQIPEPEIKAPAQPVIRQAATKKEDTSSDKNEPPSEPPMSKSEALIAEYNKLLGKGETDLAEARKRDRMLKIGGSIGDALATYLNAQGQMNAKVPGVQVQQGAGLGKVADLFATAPEIASDLAQRSEAMMKQYAELAKGERSQTAISSKEKIADERNKALKEAAGIGASRSNQNLDLRKQQYAQLGDSQVEKLSNLKSGLDAANELLPKLEKARKSLGIIGTPIAELESKFGKNPEFQKLKQDYASLRNTLRKEIFGATLTPGEAEEFDNELTKIGMSGKQLETAIQGYIARTKLKARSRLNTIAETQPLKAETARGAIKYFGLEDAGLSQNNIPLPEGNKEVVFKGNKEYKWNPSTGKYNPTGRKKQ